MDKVDKDRKLDHPALREAKDALANDLAGRDEWRRSKIGYLTGFGAAKKVAQSSWRLAASPVRSLWIMGKDALGKERIDRLPTKTDDPAQRFKVAQYCYDRSDDDVADLVAKSQRQFTLFFVLLVLAVGWGIVTVGTSGAALPFGLGYPFAFTLVFTLLPLAARSAFWNWQLRARRLGSFMEWLRSPGEWMPPDPDGPGKPRGGRRAATWLLLFAATVLLPSVAYAADPYLFNKHLGDDDLFHRMLMIMLPGVGPIGTGLPGTGSPYALPLKNAFGAFNATLLILASAMLGWHTLSGAVATAHEGKVLGQRWHQIWAPVRVTMGVGFLAPVAGGFCAAQLLVLQLIVWGGSMANHVWGSYLDTFQKPSLEEMAKKGLDAGDLMSGQVAAAQAKNLLRSIAEKELCYATIAIYNGKTSKPAEIGVSWIGIGGDLAIPDEYPAKTMRPAYTGRGFTDWARETAGLKPDYYVHRWDYGPVCGALELDTRGALAATQDSGHTRSDLIPAAKVGAMREEIGEKLVQGIEQARPPLFRWALHFAQRVQDGEGVQGFDLSQMDPEMVQALRHIGVALTGLSGHARELVQREVGGTLGETMVAEGQRLGWASAGTFYFTLSRLQGAVSSLTTFMPVATAIDRKVIKGTGIDEALFSPMNGTLELFRAYMGRTTDAAAVDSEATKAGLTESDSIGWVEEQVTSALASLIAKFKVDPMNPLTDMVDFGHSALNVFTGAILLYMVVFGAVGAAAAVGAVAGAAATAPTGPGSLVGAAVGGLTAGFIKAAVGSVLAPLAWIAKMLVMMLLAVGVVHAYILPLVPYTMHLFAVMGLMILTVEAMVAAPLWAFFHVRLDGQDFVDQVQRPGYMIAFNLLLRPSLIIFGLILSYGVFGAGLWFVNETFYAAATSVFSGHTAGPIGLVVMVIIMTYLHYQMCMRSFSLITQVPDRVTRWFGQGGENLGEEKDNDAATSFIVGGINRRVDGLTQGAASRSKKDGGDGAGTGKPGGDDKKGDEVTDKGKPKKTEGQGLE